MIIQSWLHVIELLCLHVYIGVKHGHNQKKQSRALHVEPKSTGPQMPPSDPDYESVPNLYTMRLYKSSPQTAEEMISIICLCLQHPVYEEVKLFTCSKFI